MTRNFRWPVLAVLSLLLVAGCSTQARYYSSVVDYLYPGKSDPVENPAVPVMSIPIKVAVAFVPDSQNVRQGGFWHKSGSRGRSKQSAGMALSENQKFNLMKDVSEHFRKYAFIGAIEIIPSAYLTPQGSFANLDQIRNMYGVDAVALLSYDQVQFTDEGSAALLYWTIVGAYLIPGEKNTTQTMMDAVVYDIKSRKMLFRAPGLSQVKGSSTPVNLSEELRVDSERGFQEAAKDLVKNLDTQLALFRDKVKSEPQQYRVQNRPGYKGGGHVGGLFLALLALVGGLAWLRQRRA